MTFEEWWEAERVGASREEELDFALRVDYWKVAQMIQEAFEAGRKVGYFEGSDDTYKTFCGNGDEAP